MFFMVETVCKLASLSAENTLEKGCSVIEIIIVYLEKINGRNIKMQNGKFKQIITTNLHVRKRYIFT